MNPDCHDSGGNFTFSVTVKGLQEISNSNYLKDLEA